MPRRSRLTFQVDLFPGHGHLPTNLEEVSERETDIRYSSRTRVTTDTLRQVHDVRHNHPARFPARLKAGSNPRAVVPLFQLFGNYGGARKLTARLHGEFESHRP